MINIHNRRYIGGKKKIIPYIKKIVNEEITDSRLYEFADIFAGTGVVAYEFAKMGFPVVVNDLLYSNVVAYNAWFSNLYYDKNKIEQEILFLNNIKAYDLEENYVSKIYSGKYFSNNDSKKIGYIREYIEENRNKYTEREYFILLASLLYAIDKIANTVGHYESYLKKDPIDYGVELRMLEIVDSVSAEIYNQDANRLVKNKKFDIVYIDPPYNARQYVNFYHVLENIARWEKPTEFEGDSMKFKRNHLKSGYSQSKAPLLMNQLISDLDCNLIILSYNNTYNAKSGASNNKITEEEIINYLSEKGNVKKIEIDYKGFNAGKTDFKDHKELLYICKVNKQL